MISFFAPGVQLVSGTDASLGEDAAHHARVRRVEPGAQVRVLDGLGTVAEGHVAGLTKGSLSVSVARVSLVPRPTPLEVIVPVADRDRMLLAAEKCAEFQVTAWRPAYFARSRSVSPRGEGSRFAEKVRARMASALEQSGNAWLPEIAPEVDAMDAFQGAPATFNRILLDSTGSRMGDAVTSVPTIVAVGPEGGLEPAEITAARQRGWTLASLAEATLRFETAIIAAVAVIRAAQLKPRSV